MIEFDAFVYGSDQPAGGTTITLHGVSLSSLQQAQQFANGTLILKGGMGKGLPLTNPAQSGVLFSGSIQQSFGNWTGTEMTLTFVVYASDKTLDVPGAFVLNWPSGTPLSKSISNTLSSVFGSVKQNIQISSSLVLPNNEIGFYSTLEQYSSAIMALTTGFLGVDYPGVSIAFNAGVFEVSDQTITPTPTTLVFTDLMGQPAWLAVKTMQVKTVLRADLQIYNTIKMPVGLQNAPGIVNTAAESQPSYNKYQSTFQGVFGIRSVRHVGNLRDPSGDSWVSIFNCYPVSATP
jgi:hypothetical protein